MIPGVYYLKGLYKDTRVRSSIRVVRTSQEKVGPPNERLAPMLRQEVQISDAYKTLCKLVTFEEDSLGMFA